MVFKTDDEAAHAASRVVQMALTAKYEFESTGTKEAASLYLSFFYGDALDSAIKTVESVDSDAEAHKDTFVLSELIERYSIAGDRDGSDQVEAIVITGCLDLGGPDVAPSAEPVDVYVGIRSSDDATIQAVRESEGARNC
ncbi:MAG: hypothetical protein ACTJHU_10790 [Mycetocola sp.]